MPKVCLCFHVHQPVRLSRFSYFGIGSGDGASLESRYFDNRMNEHYFNKAADQCYLPANRILQQLLDDNRGKFRFSLSITGTLLMQARKYRPEVVESFRNLCATGRVDVLDETYYHSLSSLYSDLSEFKEQVQIHNQLVRDLLGVAPKSFRNTEAIYSDRIAQVVEGLGYKAIITEGVERILGWRSPNYVYRPQGCSRLKLLMRNYKLSDDVGFRFSAKSWKEWPLTADKYATWLSATPGQVINLFMDYETFGEHHWKDTGILDFLSHLPAEVHRHPGLSFSTVTEAAESFEPCDAISVPSEISWADAERNTSAWLGNRIQRACFSELEALLPKLRKANDVQLWETYRQLQTSDHLMYLSTKGMSDREVHDYFSPYKDSGPYDNFISFMNIITDFKEQVDGKIAKVEKVADSESAPIEKEKLLA